MARQDNNPVFRSAFKSPEDEFDQNLGIRPVVFDILAPDYETSILPNDMRLVLHVNPRSMAMSYTKVIERIQTKGGYVEQHWGEGTRTISFEMATGGFKRLYTGLSNVTGGGEDLGGTRRETIAYDKYLDVLALFHNNGAVYDSTGQIAFQGIIKVSFDGGIYYGWFNNFTVNEDAEQPYMFQLSAQFTVSHEIMRLRSMPYTPLFYSVSVDASGSIQTVAADGTVTAIQSTTAQSLGGGQHPTAAKSGTKVRGGK